MTHDVKDGTSKTILSILQGQMIGDVWRFECEDHTGVVDGDGSFIAVIKDEVISKIDQEMDDLQPSDYDSRSKRYAMRMGMKVAKAIENGRYPCEGFLAFTEVDFIEP